MGKKRFVQTYHQGVMDGYQVIVDTETGVNYLFAEWAGIKGLTVLLDKDGKPLITDVSDIKK